MRKLPRDLVPLRVLAAQAGVHYRTVWLHKLSGLLAATLWTGLYEKNGRAAVNTINVVTIGESRRYLAWLKDRQERARGLGQKPGSFKIDAAIERLKAGEPVAMIAASRGQSEKNLKSILRRRGIDWRAYEGMGRKTYAVASGAHLPLDYGGRQ
jgi:hypothetical protein